MESARYYAQVCLRSAHSTALVTACFNLYALAEPVQARVVLSLKGCSGDRENMVNDPETSTPAQAPQTAGITQPGASWRFRRNLVGRAGAGEGLVCTHCRRLVQN